ncbi:Nuclear pore complex protein [Armadillidium nasatum]|uniref:Nuclear pore complex protein n=1 Tax=Armadillidium nasatum TaxID=96803 RepID=A0A5N5SKR0_9CRUS|nr:Nuclear pore complex protein [Armadillidium nasatum]
MLEDPREKALNDTLKCLDAALSTPTATNRSIAKSMRDEDQTLHLDVTAAPHSFMHSEINLNETSAALLAQDDPGVKAAQVLFSEFVDIFVTNSSDAQIWDEITAYERVCARQAEVLQNIIRKVPRHHCSFVKTEQMALKMVGERNTWRLLGSLFYERLNNEDNGGEEPMIDTTKDRTDKAIISQLYSASSFLREAQNVIDWLEKNAIDDLEINYFDRVDYFGNTHVAWENTLRHLKNNRGSRKFGMQNNHMLVSSLDPDAAVRQGKKLHDLDQEEDHRLLKCMFACVRAGQLVEAQELCAKSGQHWRAAALEGWKLYHDPNNNDLLQRQPVSGNRYRDVWKAVAWRTASNTNLVPEERAVFGSFCGHLPAMLQKYLILDDIDGLVKIAHGWLSEEDLSPHVLRCLTHLLLVLKRLGRVSYEMEDQINDILHACVKEAMERGDIEQVARYSSVLPECLQTRSYADFLINICEEHHRKHALSLASMVGLNTAAITSMVVTKIRVSPSADVSNELIADTTADDKIKINALDWLLYDKSQRPEALRQANAIIRQFLISRKVSAAKVLFQKIPSDTIDVIIKLQEAKTGSTELPTYYENRIREYLCYKTFLDAQEAFTDWFDHYHQKKPVPPKKPKSGCSFQEQLAYDHNLQVYNSDYDRWKNTMDLITKKASERLYNVLLFPDGGWLNDMTPLPTEGEQNEDDTEMGEDTSFWKRLEEGKSLDLGPEDDILLEFLEPQVCSREPSRAHQLTALRSVFIPQATSLLQTILHCTENYKECVQLADLIASEQHSLYKCFGSGEMQRFLYKMQDTCKELLDRNFDALGYPLR